MKFFSCTAAAVGLYIVGCGSDPSGYNIAAGGSGGSSSLVSRAGSGGKAIGGGAGGDSSQAGARGNTTLLNTVVATGPADTGCAKASGSACVEYAATTADLRATLDASCVDGGSTITASCSRSGLLGVCVLPIVNTGAYSRDFFYQGSVSNLEYACVAANGLWLASL